MASYCQECGAALAAETKYCAACGAQLHDEHTPALTVTSDTTNRHTDNIVVDNKGVYRWVYEFSLYSNPTILMVIWKIFSFIFLGMFVFMMLLEIGSGFVTAVSRLAPVFLGLTLGMLALSTLAYYLYALVLGGKYCVLFEMDDKGIKHIQMPRSFKKAQVLGHILMLAGAMAGNPGVVGQGLLVGSKQSTYSKFKSVRSIQPNRRRQVIKINSTDLVHNQVYVEQSDFDFVLGYIQEHVEKAQTKKPSRRS